MTLPPPPPLSSVRLSAGAVKSLAHPLRSRLVDLLRHGGPATATSLAAALGTNSGATSYHLRQLCQAGLVVDTGGGRGRAREWAAADLLVQPDPEDLDDDVDADTALGWLERDWLRHFGDKFGAWLDVRHRWPRRWQDAATMNDQMVLVTDEQLADLQDRVADLVASYRRVGQGNPEAKRVSYYYVAYPIDLDKAPRRR